MTFKQKVKKKGRPSLTFKVRSIKGITPKGFKLHKIHTKTKKIIFKKKKRK